MPKNLKYITPANKPGPNNTINVRKIFGTNFTCNPIIRKIIGANREYTSKKSAIPRMDLSENVTLCLRDLIIISGKFENYFHSFGYYR
jgi:hypothetical protein